MLSETENSGPMSTTYAICDPRRYVQRYVSWDLGGNVDVEKDLTNSGHKIKCRGKLSTIRISPPNLVYLLLPRSPTFINSYTESEFSYSQSFSKTCPL